jgi:hypothetical protein
MKTAVFWVVAPCSLIEVYRRYRSSETSVKFYQTRRNNPEDSHFYNRRRENLKSHKEKEQSDINCPKARPQMNKSGHPGSARSGHARSAWSFCSQTSERSQVFTHIVKHLFIDLTTSCLNSFEMEITVLVLFKNTVSYNAVMH